VIPLSPSLDHVGPLATTVADAAIILQAIAGYDRADTTTADVPVADYISACQESAGSLRVCALRSYFCDDLDPEVAAAFEQAMAVVKTLTAETKDLKLDVPIDRTLQAAESYAYHVESVTKTPELYQPETLRRIRSGAGVSVADYIQRRRELDEARRGIRDAFTAVDLLIAPTMPIPAPKIDDLLANPDALRPAELKLLRNTRPFNVWGLPAISIPCGVTTAGLPIGLQIAGPPWREDLVLRLANAYEEATAWHKRKPGILADLEPPQTRG
jgi:Asp-tRNA(Asn)/Glu-tRNA(Gln) amidotransferase A subunit family amidase